MYSQAVTHPSTNMAQCCLTSVIGRELVFSTWYGPIQELASQLNLWVLIFINQFEEKRIEHHEFPGGHPSKYYHGPMLLNFSDQTRTGAFNMVWPYTLNFKILILLGFNSGCCIHFLKKIKDFSLKKNCVYEFHYSIRYGLVVRIAGSHPAGSGSIPGTGILFGKFLLLRKHWKIQSKIENSHAGSWTRACWVKASYPSR